MPDSRPQMAYGRGRDRCSYRSSAPMSEAMEAILRITPPACLEHPGDHSPRAKIDSLYVHTIDPIEFLFRSLLDVPDRGDAGVVDENVNLVALGVDFLKRAFCGGGLRHVAFHGFGGSARRPDRFDAAARVRSRSRTLISAPWRAKSKAIAFPIPDPAPNAGLLGAADKAVYVVRCKSSYRQLPSSAG